MKIQRIREEGKPLQVTITCSAVEYSSLTRIIVQHLGGLPGKMLCNIAIEANDAQLDEIIKIVQGAPYHPCKDLVVDNFRFIKEVSNAELDEMLSEQITQTTPS